MYSKNQGQIEAQLALALKPRTNQMPSNSNQLANSNLALSMVASGLNQNTSGTSLAKNNMQLVESNRSSNAEIKAQIHLWIFEHSLKFGMKHVTKSILSKYHIYDCIKNIITSWRMEGMLDEPAPINPDILFLYLVEKLKCSIIKLAQENKDATKEPVIDIDFELLNLVVDLIENIYRRSQLMAFTTFACFIARLKLIELVCRIAKQEHEQVIMKRLDVLFPNWTEKYEVHITSKIRIPERKSLEQLRSSHTKIRRYILELLSSEEKKQNYLKKSFGDDVKDILKYTSKHLDAFPKFSEGKLPPTAIEQLINGAYANTGLDNEPAIRILLDNLTVESTEKDFMIVLDMFSPNLRKVSLRDCFDEFSESDSEHEITTNKVPLIEEPPTPAKTASQALNDFYEGSEDLFLPQSAQKGHKAKKSTNNSVIVQKKRGRPKHFSVKKSRTSSPKKSVPLRQEIKEPSVNKEPLSSDEDFNLTVRRRLYLNSADNASDEAIASTSCTPNFSNEINGGQSPTKVRVNPSRKSKKSELSTPAPQSVKLKRTRQSRPAPQSVKDDRKNIQSKPARRQRIGLHHKTLKKLQKIQSQMRASTATLEILNTGPSILTSPYKKRSLRVSLYLRGIMRGEDGSDIKFYA